MIHRIAACALALVCVITILFIIALRTHAADFEKDWLLEDLTCEELVSGYNFDVVVMNDLMLEYDNCRNYADSLADSGFGALHCALLKKEGVFVSGMINDIVGVFAAKRCGDR